MSFPPLRVLVIDDSAYNRRKLGDILASSDAIQVVGKASDGEEALRLATTLRPDVITLDLEMPRMDGFTFLRILMSKQPTPVIVVSSYSQKENVFKALELGALDFVAKPDRRSLQDSEELRRELVSKVLMVRGLRLSAPKEPALDLPRTQRGLVSLPAPPRHIVVVAASTGGPTAVLEIFSKIPPHASLSVLVAQHMPEKFTRTFAERLNRRGGLKVSEAEDQAIAAAQTGFVCPGQKCMELYYSQAAQKWRLRVKEPDPEDRYVPSADRLFRSAARAAKSQVTGIILTGMGDDGTEGAKAILEMGGRVIAESQESAVVFGMPGSAIRAGAVSQVMPLAAIAEHLAALDGTVGPKD